MDYSKQLFIRPINQPTKLPHILANLTPLKSRMKRMQRSTSNNIEQEKRNGLDHENESTNNADSRKLKKNKLIVESSRQFKEIDNADDQLHQYNRLDQSDCGLNKSDRKRENCVLHMNYNGQLAALVCKVRTNDLPALKHRLSPLLRQHKSRFRNVLVERNLFKQTGLIHALMTCATTGDFADLEQALQCDALRCKAQGCKIVSIEKGTLCFNCQPADIPKVLARLKLCGYKPLHTEVGHCSRETPVKLTAGQLQRYGEFLKALHADTDIVKVYDNVENSTLHG
ncbi:uncharacterized protein LOC117790621 [Drosophila innubila]|uniref:uncharacterized protein LOC117790621 n=1 Tax=Drosophila innubila TaxID=198719 RepID=UPI00148C71A0|nr:uncharacterized protein LOC117790621 [Drosophila innubila]